MSTHQVKKYWIFNKLMSEFRLILASLWPRRHWAMLLIVLPIPFLLNLAIHGGGKLGIPESPIEGGRTDIAVTYFCMGLLISTFFVQIIYTGKVMNSAVKGSESLGIGSLLVYYFLGNTFISLLLELIAGLPLFLPDYLVSKEFISKGFYYPLKLILSLVACGCGLELWFRYFRSHALRFQNKTLLRQLVFKKHSALFAFLLVLFSILSFFPEKGLAMAVSGVFDAFISVMIWEILGIELRALNDENPSILSL